MPRVEILNGVERRRRWPDAEKRRILEETLVPGVRVADVARRNGVATSLVFGWRRQAREAAGNCAPMFLPVEIADPASVARRAENPGRARRTDANEKRPEGFIEIELCDGRRVRVDARVDADALGRVLEALARAGRAELAWK